MLHLMLILENQSIKKELIVVKDSVCYQTLYIMDKFFHPVTDLILRLIFSSSAYRCYFCFYLPGTVSTHKNIEDATLCIVQYRSSRCAKMGICFFLVEFFLTLNIRLCYNFLLLFIPSVSRFTILFVFAQLV
uniref:Uncharacterized protein n=1 Tax=Ciona intestinalis TaxID=7719 RepID=H2Y172_CIOIN